MVVLRDAELEAEVGFSWVPGLTWADMPLPHLYGWAWSFGSLEALIILERPPITTGFMLTCSNDLLSTVNVWWCLTQGSFMGSSYSGADNHLKASNKYATWGQLVHPLCCMVDLSFNTDQTFTGCVMVFKSLTFSLSLRFLNYKMGIKSCYSHCEG